MKIKLWVIALCACAIALMGYLWLATHDEADDPLQDSGFPKPADPPESGETGLQSQDSQAQVKDNTVPESTTDPDIVDPRITRLADGYVHYNPAVVATRELASMDPINAMSVLQQTLDHYRYFYKENPFGSENFEITEHLIGKNPKNIIFIEPTNPALLNNELVDAWGTPYFFHVVGISNIEIYSAGPDRKLWTHDDMGEGVLMRK